MDHFINRPHPLCIQQFINPYTQVTSGGARDVGQGAVIYSSTVDDTGTFQYSTAEERRAASEPEGGAC